MSPQTGLPAAPAPARARPVRLALAGNPNCGKTTLFNRLCGLRARTANFPGTTVEARVGTAGPAGRRFEVIDLPGHYGLNLDRPESRFCRDYLAGDVASAQRPDAVVVVVDATNLARHLVFASQALQQGLPAVVAVTMIDVARRRGLSLDLPAMRRALGCPVVAVSVRTREGLDELLDAAAAPALSTAPLPDARAAEEAADWAAGVAATCVTGGRPAADLTDRLDAVLTHPLVGTAIFAAVMTGLFYAIFSLAALPMDLIELTFASVGRLAGSVFPAGPIRDLAVDGVVAGVAGAVVFVPQIFLLFFLIGLLEESGYLARAVFVTDRLLRPFGLPGQSFVPLLSAHACAIPAVMSARFIADPRQRLATILVAPFMSCSARLPVYVLLIGLLFAGRPWLAGLAFAGCYALGAVAAILTALLLRRTVLRGDAPPTIMELPDYRWPSLRGALLAAFDRVLVFLRKAGTTIVAICIVLWWLGAYPHVEAPPAAAALRAEAAAVAPARPAEADALLAEAASLEARHAKAASFIGRIGRAAEPVFAPIGLDWQLSVGVLSSLIAREVFVSTMAVVISGSEDDSPDDPALRQRIVNAQRADGSPVLTTATAASLLVFYVLAMQCLPTLAVVRRETGSWAWPAAQLAWMTGVAWIAALLVYRGLGLAGVA